MEPGSKSLDWLLQVMYYTETWEIGRKCGSGALERGKGEKTELDLTVRS